jgi:hypothetical protein
MWDLSTLPKSTFFLPSFIFLFIYFLVVLVLELRASCLPGRCCTTCVTPPAWKSIFFQGQHQDRVFQELSADVRTGTRTWVLPALLRDHSSVPWREGCFVYREVLGPSIPSSGNSRWCFSFSSGFDLLFILRGKQIAVVLAKTKN